jgi:putative endonuclease
MTSPTGTLYTGMTSNLERRVYEHKQKLQDGFTKQYNVRRLVYFEETNDVQTALTREKEIKKWRRSNVKEAHRGSARSKFRGAERK